MHIKLSEFTENLRQKQKVSCATLTASLLAGYSGSDHRTGRKIKRSFPLSSLHICVNYVLNPPVNCAVEELLCNTNGGEYFLPHLMIVSCVSSISKSKDLLIVKRSNQNPMQYYSFDAKKWPCHRIREHQDNGGRLFES